MASSAAASSSKKLKALAETTTVMAAATTTTTSVEAGGNASPSPTTSSSSPSPTAAASSLSSPSTALRDSLAGAVAGSANLLCGYPFDIVKTTLQAAPPGTYSSPWDAARAIARGQTAATLGAGGGGGLDAASAAAAFSSSSSSSSLPARDSTGFRAFFRGASAPLVGAALETGVNYACYSASLRALSGAFAGPSSEAAREGKLRGEDGDGNGNGGDPRLTAPLPLVATAAAVAGGALSFVLSPFELVKVRLQADAAAYSTSKASPRSSSHASSSSSGPASVVRATLAAEGAAGLTRGLLSTAAREVPGNAIFFVTYEALRRRFYFFDEGVRSPKVAGSALSSSSSASSSPSSPSYSSPVASAAAASVAAGGIAGGLMWACVLPVDVAKTRIQLERPGAPRARLLPTLAALAREGGRRSLWAGLAPTLARAVPANAAQWLAFEAALSVWPKGGGGE